MESMRVRRQPSASCRSIIGSISRWRRTTPLSRLAKCSGSRLRRRAVLGVIAEPVVLELLDHRGKVGLGQVHLVERLHGGEPGLAAREGRAPACASAFAGRAHSRSSSTKTRSSAISARQARTASAPLPSRPPRARAKRLGLGVDGQDGVAERDGVADGNVHQPVVGVGADGVVVRGLAADDAAERDAAVEAGVGVVRADQPCLDGLGQRLRDLQRAGHGDALVGGAAAASSSAMAPAASSSAMAL